MNPQKPGLWVFRLPKLPVKLNCTQENRDDILKWCREELALLNRIGDLKEYKAAGYKLLHSSEMEILFQKEKHLR